jgi:hypothetical protein
MTQYTVHRDGNTLFIALRLRGGNWRLVVMTA